VIYPDFPDSLYQDAPSNRYGKDETSSERTTRQTNNRRPLNGGPQTFPSNEEEDPFDGLDTPVNQPSNNRPSGQWANNGNNNQWPNQQQASRPQNQNQRPNNGNQRPNQQQNFGGGGRPQGQNQWSNNGGNQGQGQNQWSNNGGNQGQGQNQWSNNGGSQGQGNNRPTNQNQNQQQTSPTSNSEITEEQRNVCNTNCRERNTNEYNPVCGSDSLTYQNRRFLTCVANCGIREDILFNTI